MPYVRLKRVLAKARINFRPTGAGPRLDCETASSTQPFGARPGGCFRRYYCQSGPDRFGGDPFEPNDGTGICETVHKDFASNHCPLVA